MADEDDAMSSAPPTGTPSGGPMPQPGVAAGNAAPGGPAVPGQGPGILPPQGAGVPMQVKALGAHSAGIDILRACHMALKKCLGMLMPGSKEESAAIQSLQTIGKVVHTGEQGKEDQVDPIQRVQEAIAMRRMGQQGPPQGAPPPPAPPQPNTGPVPMPGIR